jgi:hypothetical protein
MRLQHGENQLKRQFMSPLLFTFVFQGLAFWALCCFAKGIVDFLLLKKNPLHKLLYNITNPVLQATNFVTPAIIPKSLHIFLAAFWLLMARTTFFLLASAYGHLPQGAL